MSDAQKSSVDEMFGKLNKEIAEHRAKFVWQDEIQWPLEITGVKFKGGLHSTGIEKLPVGTLVIIRVCGKETTTHLGLYLGDFPTEILFEFNKETNGIELLAYLNPAILVPKLKKIVWGCESWWGPIKNEEELRQITNEEIGEIWYVKLLKEIRELGKEPCQTN